MSTSTTEHSNPTEDLLEQLLMLARTVATQAGSFLAEGLKGPRIAVETKSSAVDMVSEMDKGAEELIVGFIQSNRPNDAILGEEGTSKPGTTGVRWIIDPLDGTTNYLYGQPLWAVSIGIEIDDIPSVGVVYSPVLGELFHAVIGKGAFCNDQPIHASDCSQAAVALVATGFGYSPELRAWQGTIVAGLLPQVRDIRRGGSAALELAFVASGRVDVYYERGCNAWDFSAGTVLVREAGGVVTDLFDGQPANEMCLAAAPGMHEWVRSYLQRQPRYVPAP